ncbi:MAG: NHLP family bacteriocin export ABC transporter peptidase/permease/ATPase subunit [Lachnospiraceae bacterium]|nr:NHLP family bacteriocin export ABC transporter peptidase/permease/ATPase subunit [Lachnospiraceae bacterium]
MSESRKNTGKTKQPLKKGIAKVPTIMQLETMECGAASLAMIMAYYDKWVPLEQVRADCGVSRNGANAKNIMKAARSYGFKTRGFFFEPKVLRNKGGFPCIIHWNLKHFVVLKGFKGKYAYLNDPSKGDIRVSFDEFDKCFTGIAIFLEPGEEFEPGGKKKSVFSFARKKMMGAKQALVLTMIFGLISFLFGLINPVTNRIYIDRLLTGYNPEWFKGYVIVMVALIILQLIVSAIQAIYKKRMSGKLSVIGSSSYMWKVLHLPMDFFSQRMSGDIAQRQGTNAGIAEGLVEIFAPVLLNNIMIGFYLFVMLRISVILTAIGLFSIFLNFAVSRIIAKKRVNIARTTVRDSGKLAATTVSGIEMIESIKASGAENGFFQRWAGYQASVNAGFVKYTRLEQRFGLLPTFISVITSYTVQFMSIYLVINGKFTIGLMVAFQGYMGSFINPAHSLISADQTLQELRTKMERIDDVMEYPDDPMVKDTELDDTTDYKKLSGKVELKNVTFGYQKLDEPLIKDLSFTLEAGKRVAIVGGSGCGKSTLSRLISGLHRPWSGEILFDGIPIEKINRQVFTGTIAVVDQDIILFDDTIANNIKMWDESIEDFEMILAARDAQLHDDIMQREGGYNYHLSEGGKDLSGGQRQRLEIARVLAQDPSIIILDEATSALDAKTEYEVVRAIKDRGVSCLVIAHRLSTIKDCDEIIVMDHGRIVERGSHEDLMKNNGLYAELVANE